MRWFGLFILLIICSSFITSKTAISPRERIMMYLGCELFDGASTLSFIDKDNKKLKILLLLPADDLNFSYSDFVTLDPVNEIEKVNDDSLYKAFVISFDEKGRVIGIKKSEEPKITAENTK